jgi:FkbH-like protein
MVNLIELLERRAVGDADRTAFTFLADGEREERSVTCAELALRARAVAANLREHVAAGARALLLYPAGIEYLEAFFGCLYAGVIAVPAEMPRSDRNLARFEAVLADCGAAVVLTTTAALRQMRRRLPEIDSVHGVRWLFSDIASASGFEPERPDPHSVAYLQYTSGSTATPKGVIITHANVLSNIAYIDRGFRHTRDSISVNWLPHFHDMGLVYGLLAPIYGGFPSWFMSPAAFVQKPLRWLAAITKYGATHSGGPNFAYDLCVRNVTEDQRSGLDLSTWRVAFNGAEPVRQSTLESFAEVFAPYGFRFDAFHPAYGLAEATLKVSARDPDRPLRFSVDGFTSCGVVGGETRVEIVNREICVSGPGVAPGYWGRESFDGMLRTGDLGFIRDGELYVAGRVKDLIIIRGRNHYPQDIELTAERSHPALRPGAAAAFAVEQPAGEALVVVQELQRGREGDAEDAIRAIRLAVAEAHEIAPYAIVLIRTGTIPKTSSGKIQRQLAKHQFLDRKLQIVAESIGIAELDYAPDSLTAMEIRARLEQECEAPLPAADPVLSMEQERLWLLEQIHPGNPSYRVPGAAVLLRDVGLDELRAAVREVALRHEPLRMTFPGPKPVIAAEPAVEFGDLEAPLDLARGPLFRLRLQGRKLEAVFHHIIADLWSVGIFFRELAAVLAGERLPPLPATFSRFAAWQRRLPLERQLDFWRRKLADVPRIEWPGEAERTSGIEEFTIPPAFAGRVASWSAKAGVTPFATLLAGFKALLAKYSGSDEMVVGTPVAGRPRGDLHPLIGFFAYPVLVRTDLTGDPTFAELVERVRNSWAEAQEHDAPFAKVVEAVSAGHCSMQAPLAQVMFGVFREPSLAGGVLRTADAPGAPTDFDLFLTLVERPGGIRGVLACGNPALAGAAREIGPAYVQLLEAAIANPETPLSLLPLGSALEAEARQTIAVAASFTAEPIQPVLEFWSRELHLPARVRFAPYGQVFQALLDGNGVLGANRRGTNVVLVRVADLGRNALDDFVAAIQLRAPVIVAICPSVEEESERQLARELAAIAGVEVITPERVTRLYPVATVFDPHADELGHVPYTEEFFIALGTTIARTMAAQKRAPHKVVVLDCDGTLWRGVCGEDGPEGLVLDSGRRALHEAMLEQHRAGMLLAVCSKNNEDDVDLAFARRPDFPLRPEHFTARRINWISKAENLRTLAHELLLGVDSFVFIDDNPVECAEVRASHPEVLTVELPEEPGQIEPLLRHLWPLDHLRITEEDRSRSRMYKQDVQRRSFEKQSVSLASFLEGLRLEIRTGPPRDEEIARVAQLTQRTNQFNCSSVRRTEAEVRELIASGTAEVRVVHASDRFGDYGLVGVLIFTTDGSALRVDTFLLSCRALGRGIEHRMLASMGDAALQRGLGWVDVAFVPTRRNKPALQFLEHAGSEGRRSAGGAGAYRFAAARAVECRYNAEQEAPEPLAVEAQSPQPVRARPVDWLRIAREYQTVEQIRSALRARVRSALAAPAEDFVEPRTPLEQELAGIWSELLHVRRVSAEADFFAIGGHSLMAVQLLARVRERFQAELSLDVVFSGRFTIAALAEAIEAFEIRLAGPEADAVLAELEGLSDEEIRELLRG